MSVDKPILNALQKKGSSRVPFWFMRQAGRYLPEYRELRTQAGSFLDLCYSPELATEVTLQPIRRFAMDGAILFSDILVLPHALGADVRFVQGEGPIVERIVTAERIAQLDHENILPHIAPVLETIRRVKAALPLHVTLLGFAGAPFTVASYMVEGKGSKEYHTLRDFFYGSPDLFQSLIDHLTEATITYLSAQIEAGAEVVQLFDSWAGILAPEPFARYCIEPNRIITHTLKARYPHIPVICFPRGAGSKLAAFHTAVQSDGLSLDYSMDVSDAVSALSSSPTMPCLQGNLDPMLLVSNKEAMLDAAKRALDTMQGRPYIFNLGHGFTPDTKIENVEALCALLKTYT